MRGIVNSSKSVTLYVQKRCSQHMEQAVGSLVLMRLGRETDRRQHKEKHEETNRQMIDRQTDE